MAVLPWKDYTEAWLTPADIQSYLAFLIVRAYCLTQNLQAPPGDVLDLTNDVSHGKCNVIFVGIIPTAAQKLQLESYSRRFKVRCIDKRVLCPALVALDCISV